jgi:Ca-activated chloride channel family protein
MTFATPALLLLLPVVALLALSQVVLPRRPADLAIGSAEVLQAANRPTWRVRLRWLPSALRWSAIALAVVAIARPRGGLAVTQMPSEGIDIVIALDVSSSMTVFTGVTPGVTRLLEAQQVVNAFVGTLDGDRVGLVVFRSRARALSPLTHDVTAIQHRVGNMMPELIDDGTAIGLGISEALTLLEDSPARSRVVVLLTDGQNNAGAISPEGAARLAVAFDVRVYTIGFVSGAGFGETPVDAVALQAIAEATGAQYYNAQSQEELVQAYVDISELEQSRVGERRFVAFREYAPWFLLGAIALLLGESALRATWLRRYP